MNINQAIEELVKSTHSLHQRFNIPEYIDLDSNDMNNRLRIQIEEIGELARAISYENKEEILSESVDIAVVAIGTLLLLGGKVIPAIESVVKKNNSKTNDTHHLIDGKIIRK